MDTISGEATLFDAMLTPARGAHPISMAAVWTGNHPEFEDIGESTVQPPSLDSARTTTRMAYLCAHLAEIRRTLGDASLPLQTLLDTIRADGDRDITTAVSEVHRALQTAGDAPALDGCLREHLVGVDSLDIVYRCPLKLCDGRAVADIVDDPPHCAVNGEHLLRERLP